MQAECVMLCVVEVLTFSGAVKSRARERWQYRSDYEKRCRAARHVPAFHGESCDALRSRESVSMGSSWQQNEAALQAVAMSSTSKNSITLRRRPRVL
jgi:hypothetical protein